MPLLELFKNHPDSVGETYLEHMRAALAFSFTMVRAAVACSVHAFLPFLFVETASGTVDRLSREMARGRRPRPSQQRQTASIESDLCQPPRRRSSSPGWCVAAPPSKVR